MCNLIMKSIQDYITEKMVYNSSNIQKTTFVKTIKELKSLINETDNKFSLTNISFEEFEEDIFELQREFPRLITTNAKVIDVSNWIFGDKIVNIEALFSKNHNVKEIIGLDTWDVSNIENFGGLFEDCDSIETIDGIENWNVSKAIKLSGMFSKCSSLKKLDLSKWNVSNVKYNSMLFAECKELKEIKGLDKWNTNMFYACGLMFKNCSSLEALDLSNWQMGNVQTTNEMFAYCDNLETIGDVSKWDVSNVKDMSKMFYYCGHLECDCSSWKLHIRCNTYKVSTWTSRRIFNAPKRKIQI